jgi:hypothetical protein
MAKRPPKIDLKFSELPADPNQRHEALVGVFGQSIIWLRNRAIEEFREVVESEEAREKLGTIRRRKYDAIAALNPEERLAACKFAEAAMDRVLQLLLTMLSGTGTDQRLGDDHAIRFKLLMEILEVENAEVVSEETINRGGEKFFADYWGRWLNRFGEQPPT